MRTGLIMEKIKSSSFFNEKGERVHVTLLKMDDCEVLDHRTIDKNGYEALVLAYGKVHLNRISKPMKKVFEKANIEAKKHIKEFRISSENFLNVGHKFTTDYFREGQYIDVKGCSIGKGFAGAMKRHNFRGLEATHGVSITHRSHGSTGANQDPGRVFKNKKMAGHLGAETVTIQNLRVVKVMVEDNVLVVKGSVPGKKGSYLYISDAVKK
ncbi:MAG: 50S ribosomal protein L3 [Alphaproteobacteria bacterium]|nr:50S ribosomal protein L3 [Alphaproteobacteria bacterium]